VAARHEIPGVVETLDSIDTAAARLNVISRSNLNQDSLYAFV
jgi:hypothetical protein